MVKSSDSSRESQGGNGDSRTDRSASENRMNGGGGYYYSWRIVFDWLVQSGNQMVFLEQSSYFSLFPENSANINSFPLS